MFYTEMDKIMNKLLIICLAFFYSNVNGVNHQPQDQTMSTGWYLWDPYQYEDIKDGIRVLTGLEIKLTQSIFSKTAKKPLYQRISWNAHQQKIKEGKIKFAAGATKTPTRELYAHFSQPYRYEENSLFQLRKSNKKLVFSSIETFLNEIKTKNFRIAVIDGFIYADKKINDWIADRNNQDLVIKVKDDAKSLELLLQEKVDGFLADRIVGATLAWRRKITSEIIETKLNIKAPIHFMFSKKAVPEAFVEKVNQAINTIKNTDEYGKIVAEYLYPVLLLNIASTDWFLLIELIGVIAFAISGIIIAYEKKSTIFGALIFATIPAIGGGIIRDTIFDKSPDAIRTPIYFITVIITVIIGVIIIRIKNKIDFMDHRKALNIKSNCLNKITNHLLVISDAMGLAVFVVSGVILSILAKIEPLWLFGPIFATITGSAGGVLRDIIAKRPIASLNEDLYSEIAIIWGFLLSVFLTYQTQQVNTDYIKYSVICTIIGVFITRLLCYFYKIPNIHIHTKTSSKK